MNSDIKNRLKKMIVLIPIVIIASVFYMMFKDNYKEIFRLLLNVNPLFLALILFMGASYQILDAIPFKLLIQRKLEHFSLFDSIKLCLLGIFLNVTTFGTGIKPGQAYYLNKKGMDLGNGFATLMLPYVYHKLTIVIYATLALIFTNDFIKETYSNSYGFIYAGYGLSILVILGIVLISTSKTVHRIIFYPFDRHLKKPSIIAKKELIKSQLALLQQESSDILRDLKLWLKIIPIDLIKMTFWYAIPVIAISAVGGASKADIMQIIATSAFMQLIVGVIPVTGGIGSTEVVFILLFTEIFGSVAAGSSMVLYRLANYYIPFIVSIILVLAGITQIEKRTAKSKKKY